MIEKTMEAKNPEWMAKTALVFASAMLVVSVLFALAIIQMGKRIEIDPLVFYNQKNSLSALKMEPFTAKMSSLDEMTDMYIRQYIHARFELLGNMIEQRQIWGPRGDIYRMTAPVEYRKFWAEMEPVIKAGNKRNISVAIDILSVENVKSHDRPTNLWHVEFETRALVPGSESIVVIRFFASMRIRFVKERRSTDSRLPNPLGFTVMEFSCSEKKLK